MTEQAYRQSPGLNFSTMKHYLRSPAHYKEALSQPQADTEALIFGRAFHTYILEREKFHDSVIVLDYANRPEPLKTMASKANAAWKAEMIEFNKSKTIIDTQCLEVLKSMNRVLRGNHAVSKLLAFCEKEKTLEWADPETGILCKARTDMSESVHTGTVLDLKTCQDASYSKFRKTLFDYHYYLQMAHYANGLEALTGRPHERQIIIAIEKDAPHGFGIYQLDEMTMNFAKTVCGKIYRLHAECLEKNHWPGYESVSDSEAGITEIGLTEFQMTSVENNRFIQSL